MKATYMPISYQYRDVGIERVYFCMLLFGLLLLALTPLPRL